MLPFERFFKMGQNAANDMKIHTTDDDLSQEELKYLQLYMAHLLKERQAMLVLTKEGQELVTGAFLSGVAMAGDRFGKK